MNYNIYFNIDCQIYNINIWQFIRNFPYPKVPSSRWENPDKPISFCRLDGLLSYLIIWFKLILNWTQSTLKTVKEKILLSTGISMTFKQTKLSGQIQTAWKCKQEFWITEIPTSMRLIKIFHQTIIQSAQLLLLDQKINKQPWWLKDQRLEVLN